MFYVYVYRDPRPGKQKQPVYVGKGTGTRSVKHWLKGNTGNKPFNNWLVELRRISAAPIIEIVAEFDNELDAFKKEIELIALYGRRTNDTGTLFNVTGGGQGTVGAIRTPEWRANMSASHSTPESVAANSKRVTDRWTDPEFHARNTAAIGAALARPEIHAKREAAKLISHRTPEFREKMKAVGKGFWEDPDYRVRTTAAYRAAAAQPEERARKSAATKFAWTDPAHKAARSAAIKASRTPELRAQISASCKALWTPERRAAHSAKMKAVLAKK